MQALDFPNDLDAPHRFLFWTLAQILPFTFTLFIGIMLHQLTVFVIAGIAVSWLFTRYKDSKPDGYLMHVAYWYGLPFQKTSRALINPFVRRIFPA